MHKSLRSTTGPLILVLLLVAALGASGCTLGASSRTEESKDFCEATERLEDQRKAIAAVKITSAADLATAQDELLKLVEALDEVLDAVPQKLNDDAAEVRLIARDMEAQAKGDVSAEAFFTELPKLFGQLEESGNAGAMRRISAEADTACL